MAGLTGAAARRTETPSAVPVPTAELFRARVVARRRRRVAWGLGAVAAVLLIGYLLLASPWLRVAQVRVEGVGRVSPASVDLVTAGERGRPLVLVDTAGLARRLVGIPLVRSVDVVRRWPSTLVVTVHERQPAAAVTAGAGFRLLDRDGVLVDTVAVRPTDLPLLQVDVAKAGAPTLAAVLDVLDGLPDDLRRAVTAIGGDSPDDVWFTLEATAKGDGGGTGAGRAGAAKVVWGSAEEQPRKVAALRAVQAADPPRAGVRMLYDVSAPQAPAVSVGR